jgi:hypothetical protein
LAVLRVAVVQGRNLGLRRKPTNNGNGHGSLRAKTCNSGSSASTASASISRSSSGVESVEDLGESRNGASNDDVAAAWLALPSQGTFVAPPTRYYVRVSYLPGELADAAPGQGGRAKAPPGGGELFIGHTRYSSRTHSPVWADRGGSGGSGGSDHGSDHGSGHGSGGDSRTSSNCGHRRSGSGGSSRSGSVAILGSLLDALLPSEDGRLRGGGDFGDASANDADGRTVHSVKRRWPRPLDRAPPRRLSAEEGGGAGAPSLLENGSRSGEDDGDDAFFYHILQRRRPGAASAARGSSSKGALVPWAQAPGAVRLRVLAESGLDALVDQV